MIEPGNLSKIQGGPCSRSFECSVAEQALLLPEDFQPSAWTVICGRGRNCLHHVGNRRFRVLCHIFLKQYEASKTKTEKSTIVLQILATIQSASGFSGFVKQDKRTKRFSEVGESAAREKIGQQLRELTLKKDPTKVAERRVKRYERASRRERRRAMEGMITINENQMKEAGHSKANSDSSPNPGAVERELSRNANSTPGGVHLQHILLDAEDDSLDLDALFKPPANRQPSFADMSVDTTQSPVGVMDGFDLLEFEIQNSLLDLEPLPL